MGVVRDVTVDNLVTAVGNIDTSSLAQDSTLQDVVTAIGNISGGSDPVTNTTVNSLCKDTTGQDIKDELTAIKSAVQGLGTTLGSDKANISGDNIASPATFRQNIGIGYTLINTYTSNGQTLSHDLSNYSSIVIVAYFTNTSNVTYVVGSLSLPTSEVIDNHPIVCFNDGTLRKGQLNFKRTYATTENFGNITALKVFGVN